MLWLVVHAFVVALWAVIFWGTIRLLDRHNAKNSFGIAVGLGALYAFAHMAMIPDILYLVAWLVLLLRIVTWHHNMNLLGAIVVTASTIFTPYFIMPPIVNWVGGSEVRALIVLYGVPIGVFGTWAVAWIRGRNPGPKRERALPKARVERGGRKKPVEPIVAVAPPKSPDPSTPRGDGPTLLR
jgi:hypothetical protein